MKIYDIISEAPEAVSPGGIVIPAGAKTAAPIPQAPVAPGKTAQVAGTVKKTVQTAKNVATSPGVQRVNALVKKVILRDKIAGEVVNSKMAQVLGGQLRILKMFGYATIAYELWQQKIAIETLVNEKAITKEDGDAAYRMQCEKFLAAILVSAGLRGLIRAISTVSGLRWIIRAGGALGGAPSGGATIVAALATEAVIVYLVNKLTTPEGQNMLSWIVMHIIDPGAVWMWNMGFGKLFGEIKEISAEGGEKVDTAVKANVQQSADAKTVAAGGTVAKQAAQPAAGTTTASSKPFDASGGDNAWGKSDPYADLPAIGNVKIK